MADVPDDRCSCSGNGNNSNVSIAPAAQAITIDRMRFHCANDTLKINELLAAGRESGLTGANELVFFFRILLPVCTPLIAVLILWQFVGMWNSYFDAMIYLNSADKQPLQLVLRAILIQNEPDPGMIADMQSTAQRAQLAELLKYATIIISSLPLIVMYPFFQKYFDSGIMVGSVKG